MAGVNCIGHHFDFSRQYPRWNVKKQIQQVKEETHLSFSEARKFVETSTPVAASKSYADAVEVSTTSIATQTDLTWPRGEIFKRFYIWKKQASTAIQNQQAKSTQVSLDSQNDLSGEPGLSKSKTGKDTIKIRKRII